MPDTALQGIRKLVRNLAMKAAEEGISLNRLISSKLSRA